MSRPCDENGLLLDEDDLIDNKSQSIDHNLSSSAGVITESDDCDDLQEDIDDCQRNDTSRTVYANIVFNLDEPEGKRRLREMLDASKVKLVLWALDNWLREQWKYGSNDPVPRDEAMGEARSQLYEIDLRLRLP